MVRIWKHVSVLVLLVDMLVGGYLDISMLLGL